MSVVDYNTNEWINSDGLLVKTGPDEARVTRAGTYETVVAGQHVVTVSLDLVDMCAKAAHGSGNGVIIADNVTIPAGALIEKVVLTVTEVTAGSGATLDVGLVKTDRSTEIDFDGLIVAGTTTWHAGAIGTKVEYTQGATEHGALLGLQAPYTGLLYAEADTADYTDGIIRLDIYYSMVLAENL